MYNDWLLHQQHMRRMHEKMRLLWFGSFEASRNWHIGKGFCYEVQLYSTTKRSGFFSSLSVMYRITSAEAHTTCRLLTPTIGSNARGHLKLLSVHSIARSSSLVCLVTDRFMSTFIVISSPLNSVNNVLTGILGVNWKEIDFFQRCWETSLILTIKDCRAKGRQLHLNDYHSLHMEDKNAQLTAPYQITDVMI